MKGGNTGFGKYDTYDNGDGGFSGSKESTAYTNSNYRKPFNPNNMQSTTMGSINNTASKTPSGLGGQYGNGGGARNFSQH